MQKKLVSLMLTLALALSLALSLPVAAAGAPVIVSEGIAPKANGTAYVSQQAVSVNGRLVTDLKMYVLRDENDGETNYIYVRDLAYILKDTAARFSVGYNEATNTISITKGEKYTVTGVELVERLRGDQGYRKWTDPVALNGYSTTMQAFALTNAEGGDYTYYQLRDLAQAINIYVGYDPDTDSISLDTTKGYQYASTSTTQPETSTTQPETPSTTQGDPISMTSQTYQLSSGTVSARVVTVDMNDSRVSVKAVLPDGKINNTKTFSQICAESDAQVIVDANFFDSNATIKDPIGHVMVDGQMAYGSSGLTAFGFTDDNQVKVGRPGLFYRVKTTDGGREQKWSAYDVNAYTQNAYSAILYTPARGTSVPVVYPGYVLTVENNVTKKYTAVSAGDTISIPQNGFALYLSKETAAEAWVPTPELGRTVTVQPYLTSADEEGFTLDGVTSIVSGGPRLVKDGAIETYEEMAFAGVKFSDSYASARTAIGITADNKLLLVSTTKATIPQMRELMLQLKCEDATNLDGGASTALYYKGDILVQAGRELSTTLQVFVGN